MKNTEAVASRQAVGLINGRPETPEDSSDTARCEDFGGFCRRVAGWGLPGSTGPCRECKPKVDAAAAAQEENTNPDDQEVTDA